MAALFPEPQVSVIIPILNGKPWINQCFQSILSQTARGVVNFEICVCNDASTDDTLELCRIWAQIFKSSGVPFKIYDNDTGTPKGVGYAKNKAVSMSTGKYLCFQDCDDEMLPERVLQQYNYAITQSDNTLIGCRFRRVPEGSTARYTKWANTMTENELNLQVFTSNGPTVIMPTWMCSRELFDKVGGFVEDQKGTPEDLLFFNRHLDLGGIVRRMDECLLVYTYHPESATFSVNEETIWNIRVERLERTVLKNWDKFTIWNAGKQGRKLYGSLSQENKSKVVAFCDVDEQKIGKKYEHFNANERTTDPPVDIVHFRKARTPFVICVKMDLTQGDFEQNLQSLKLTEGKDYILFS